MRTAVIDGEDGCKGWEGGGWGELGWEEILQFSPMFILEGFMQNVIQYL